MPMSLSEALVVLFHSWISCAALQTQSFLWSTNIEQLANNYSLPLPSLFSFDTSAGHIHESTLHTRLVSNATRLASAVGDRQINTIGFSIYDLQPLTSIAVDALVGSAELFGHTGVFFLPFDITNGGSYDSSSSISMISAKEKRCEKRRLETNLTHFDGKCGAAAIGEAALYSAQGFEVTYSNAHWDQGWEWTYAGGPPGRHVEFSGAEAFWHPQASTMMYIATDLNSTEFLSAAQSIAYKMNRKGGYDLARNNCQMFALDMLSALKAHTLRDELAKRTFVHSDQLSGPVHAICDHLGLNKLCWECPTCHVDMPAHCQALVPEHTFEPKYSNELLTCSDS